MMISVLLPTVKGDILLIKEFTGLSNMIKGESFGIAEPDGDPDRCLRLERSPPRSSTRHRPDTRRAGQRDPARHP